MNNYKISFIICTNNQLYNDECIYYINHLKVPDGYSVEVLNVMDAESMTAGYNEAMAETDAKYKVYLHQDTFIINPNFIEEIISIFHKDTSIGMIGLVGAVKLNKEAVMWDVDRYGKIYETHLDETILLESEFTQELLDVMVIDGLLMATQYDIPWRQDLFTKWDFYDCSQSMEFRRAGYKVIVPKQLEPWCIHDCGYVNLVNYDEERMKFIKEYL